MTSTTESSPAEPAELDEAARKEINRLHWAIENLHAVVYFAPEWDEELVAVGVRPGRMCYFAGRAAPMGLVGPGVVAATFYNFNPDLVARFFPRVWTLTGTEQILSARLRAAERILRRLLGAAADGPEVAELVELTRMATAGLPVAGRPLYAGHADLPWPDEPLPALWHGVTLLREYRGDGHLAALLAADLTGVQALVSHIATGRSFTVAAAKVSRGWSDEQWDVATADLVGRGLLEPAGGLTSAGAALRADIEAHTDSLDTLLRQRLGADRTARAIELGRALTRTLLAANPYPAGTFAFQS